MALKQKVLISLFLLMGVFSWCQSAFSLPENVKREKIHFENLFNLIIVPIEVNGTPMKFILDTGVDKTILFSVVGVDSVTVNQAEKLEINGLGSEESVIAYRSRGNHMKIKNLISSDAEIYVVLDPSRSFLPRLGTNINGIIGTDFFKNLAVEIDYERDKLFVYNADFDKSKWRRYDTIPIEVRKNKPYLKVGIPKERPAILAAIDTGNSDALWIYPKDKDSTTLFKKYFKDYLGWGLNGNIYGRRGKLKSVNFGKYEFKNVTVALPDSTSISINAKAISADGNIGAGLLKRFDIVLNYTAELLLLKPNPSFSEGFFYNMSGLTLTYGPSGIKSHIVDYYNNRENGYGNNLSNASTTSYSYQRKKLIQIVDRIMVDDVRIDSPAERAGIQKGDEILTFNGRAAYKRTLSELMQYFYREPYKTIRLKVKRGEEIFRTSFKLEPVLPDSN